MPPPTHAILPVAGLGTRFLPWTKVVPKELLPLGSEPIIAHVVDECLDAGIEHICFVISHGKELIPQYFYEDPRLEEELAHRGKRELLKELQRYDRAHFHVVYQEEQLGDGHAILQAADWVEGETVAVLFGDDLFRGPRSGLQQLLDAQEIIHDPRAVFLALEKIPREKSNRYGVVEIERECAEDARLKKLKGLVEKPKPEEAPSTLGIVGRYIVPCSTIDALMTMEAAAPLRGAERHHSEIRLIDAFMTQIKNIPIFGYECEGTRIDTGTPEGYAEAVKLFSS